MTVNIALRRQISQLQYYTEGNVPEALIGVPESWNPDQIRQFQAYWDSLLEGNTAERRHAKFVPGGVAKTFVPTREPALKDPFDEWLARVVCFAFSVSPQPFIAQINRATAETAQDTATAEGLLPLMNWVKQLADHVILTEFAAPDLEFAWADDKAADPQIAAAIATDYVKCGIKSVNEARGELGLAPVPGGDKPMILTPQGPVPLGEAPDVQSQTKKADALLRFNPNHYGPGPQGGQFAPADEGSGGYVQPAAFDPRKAAVLLNALRRWIQRLPSKPAKPEGSSNPEAGQNSDDYKLPNEAPEQGPYRTGRDLADALVSHLASGAHDAAMRLIDTAEILGWLSPQIPNVVTSVQSRIEGPEDLDELIDAVQPGLHPGYNDHHIVEQGPQNDDLSPEDQARIGDPENLVRIPTYAHIEITTYYSKADPDLDWLTPRQYLRGKSFDERYEFGLNVLRDEGLLK